MTAADLVRGSVELQSLPSIYQRIRKVVDHPHSSVTDIAKVVGEDPGLCARLLGLVNSGFFGFGEKIETVSRAIAVVGTQQLCDLSLATSVISLFDGLPSERVDMASFWKHSIATGVLARCIAKRRREPNVERLFVGGLLHDVGSLLLYARAPAESAALLARAEQEGIPLVEAERADLGFDHTEIAGALLEAWNLPDALRCAVAHHHEPATATGFATDAATVHVADWIADALEFGSSGEALAPPLCPDAWDRLGLPVEELDELIRDAEQQIADAVRVILGRA